MSETDEYLYEDPDNEWTSRTFRRLFGFIKSNHKYCDIAIIVSVFVIFWKKIN